MKTFALLLSVIWIGCPFRIAIGDVLWLNPHLEPLRPLLDKTWKGTFVNSRPDNLTVDLARWERAMNGEAVRRIHSVNDGTYGGEGLALLE